MTRRHRILVIAHAHPDFSLGGGEIAAYNLFRAYKSCEDVEDAWFLGRADKGHGATGHISLRREGEYLWEQGINDWHTMKAANQDSLTTWFADLIRRLRPTVVHTHHYAHLGLEYLRVIRNVDPSIRIVMTLHEFMAICRNNGQMIKVGSTTLCSRETPDECHRCFPDRSPEDFWLRKQYFQRHFELVDQFVSPSEFLRSRYVEWGISPERITVIENGQASDAPLPPRELKEGETRNRFAFFGQINPFKGVDVLLEALISMSKAERRSVSVEIHGANLEWQPEEFKQKIARLRTELEKSNCLRWMGPYRPDELRQRMRSVDWVLIPSIWWENSPMVIQEAFAIGRPLMVSNIGGMAEKVAHGVDGLQITVGSSTEWANQLIGATDPKVWERCHGNISAPISYGKCARLHLELVSQVHVAACATGFDCLDQ
jgi:glycosyltransferase involved in cell wall biosynthesis